MPLLRKIVRAEDDRVIGVTDRGDEVVLSSPEPQIWELGSNQLLFPYMIQQLECAARADSRYFQIPGGGKVRVIGKVGVIAYNTYEGTPYKGNVISDLNIATVMGAQRIINSIERWAER